MYLHDLLYSPQDSGIKKLVASSKKVVTLKKRFNSTKNFVFWGSLKLPKETFCVETDIETPQILYESPIQTKVPSVPTVQRDRKD